jgi:cytosine/adenosine deaminase-related metal-dependent hydrolase
MLLNNLTLVETGETVSIETENGLIKAVGNVPTHTDQLSLHFENAIAFPGLINSHDHLDFNLFPQFGDKVYNSYTEWGRYIHEHYKAEIDNVLKVPIVLREEWGMIKNLLGGVTTVVNHGEPLRATEHLINVFEDYYFIHSVAFENKWKLKLNNPLKRKFPIVIHVGEGKDEASRREIDNLIKWNYLNKRLVGVHGVAMDETQAKKFDALVWCPQSNYFLLDKTADIRRLKNSTTIVFGTDSTLTSNWNIWDHIKLTRKTAILTDGELYSALTTNAAEVWELNNNGLQPGQNADLVIARKKEDGALNAFFAVDPKDILLVMVNGDVKLFDESLSALIDHSFGKINVNGAVKYIRTDISALMNCIRQYYPDVQFPVNAT